MQVTNSNDNNSQFDAETELAIAAHYEAILRLIGEDTTREGLEKTPLRAARALLRATCGNRVSLSETVNGAVFESPTSGMVVVKDIEFYSLCEHHILPFFGHVSIGYIPKGKILGISKLARIVEMYARRLQVQERLTEQICDAIMEATGCDDVMAVCRAGHLCMKMRGVEKQDSTTVTITKRGRFEKDAQLAWEMLNS